MPAGAGLLLDQTYRMHPDLCRYTSAVFYDGRLHGADGLGRQEILGEAPWPVAEVPDAFRRPAVARVTQPPAPSICRGEQAGKRSRLTCSPVVPARAEASIRSRSAGQASANAG